MIPTGSSAGGKPSIDHESQLPRIDRAAELADAREALVRLRPEADVAEADDAVDLVTFEVGEDGVEREQVAVDVRDEADAHVPPLGGLRAY